MTISGPAVALVGAAVASVGLYVLVPDELLSWSLPVLLAGTTAVNFVIYILYRWLAYPNFVAPLRHLPSVQGGWPVFGRVLTMFEVPVGESYYKWMHTIKNDGLLRFQGPMNKDIILVTSPAALGEMLVAKSYDFVKAEKSRDFLRLVLGDGLVVVEGDEHRFQRKRLMPSFAFRHIKDLYGVMWSKAVNLCERIDADLAGQDDLKLEMTAWSSRATLDAIGVAALGKEFNSIYNDDDEIATIYRRITQVTPFRQVMFAVTLLLGPKLIRRIPFMADLRGQKECDRLRDICRQFVRDKRTAIAKHGDEHFDILSVLMKSNDFSDDELVDQMLTFLGAGSDTTSLTFSWTCWLLANNPTIQQRLRAELRSVKDRLAAASSANDTDTLASILESLPYLNGVCYETLRLYPTAPLTQRIAAIDTSLLGHPIPKDTGFLLSMVAMNRSPTFWGPDAGQYRPERWIDTATNKPNNHGGAESNYCMLTFLAGPRSCIGQNFARAELRCLIAAWVLRFEMEDANTKPVVPVGNVTLKSMSGIWLKLRRVHN